MKIIKYLIKMYFEGYRLISLCDHNPKTDNDIYCLIHKTQIPKDFNKKDHQYWLLTVKGFKIFKKYGADYLIR